MQERAKGAQHIYQSQNSTEKHLETQNEPNPSPSIPQSSKRSQIALKCVFFVKIRKKTAKGKNDNYSKKNFFCHTPTPPPFFFLTPKKPEKKLNYGRKGKQT